MRPVARHLMLVNWLSVVTLAQVAGSQQAPTNLPPDERFKADILVIAPHPDDESTIAGYLAKAVLDEHRRVAVVLTTRGDAGQNLVGYEQARSLAEIREIETRQALASIGITNVFFLRAPDTWGQDLPDVLRSLETSNHGSSLGEAVRLIRLTRPEVVITMLPATVVGENHEDHQAAAVIATEAFDLAGDPTWFPEQIAVPEDRLWYGNLMEGLRAHGKCHDSHYYCDASHFDFAMAGRVRSTDDRCVAVTARLPTRGSWAAKELSFHRTQYGDDPAKALATNNLKDYEQPLPFVLAKSLVGGAVTGDIMEAKLDHDRSHSAPVRGYRPPENSAALSMELGQAWAFYRRFYLAHNLDVLAPGLLAPELGGGSRRHFPQCAAAAPQSYGTCRSRSTCERSSHLAGAWTVRQPSTIILG